MNEITSPRRTNSWRFRCVFECDIHTHTDIRRLLKTLKGKMVMYSVVLNWNRIFRGIGKTIESKIDWKNRRFKWGLRLQHEINLHICFREANVRNYTALNFLKFQLFKYIYLFYPEWKLIWNKVSLKFFSFVHHLLKQLAFWIEQTEWHLRCTCYLIRIFSRRFYLFSFSRCFELFWRFWQ